MVEVVETQILSKVLETQDISIIQDNQLTSEFFPVFPDEYNFIMNHFNEYGNVPDKISFLSKFPEFDIVDVHETDEYLVDTILEQNLYNTTLPIVQEIADLVVVDSNKAVEHMLTACKQLQPHYKLGGVDIIQQALTRYEAFINKRDNQQDWYFTTGFPELDDIIHGIYRPEELFVIFARLNEGKSYILEKICTHIWEIGFNVGYVSPEMGDLSIGYRFDTLYRNFSNKDLMWGNKQFDVDSYKAYIEELKTHKNKFIVATPLDFSNGITVSKLRHFINQYDLKLLAIDGITYISDERGRRGDNKTITLTNICEDLKLLGMELNVPILIVHQANRGGVVDKETDAMPEVHTIKDSDGIAQVATTVLALKKGKDSTITMQVQKARNGKVGDKISYNWNPNIGEFISATGVPATNNIERKQKSKTTEKEDVF